MVGPVSTGALLISSSHVIPSTFTLKCTLSSQVVAIYGEVGGCVMGHDPCHKIKYHKKYRF